MFPDADRFGMHVAVIFLLLSFTLLPLNNIIITSSFSLLSSRTSASFSTMTPASSSSFYCGMFIVCRNAAGVYPDAEWFRMHVAVVLYFLLLFLLLFLLFFLLSLFILLLLCILLRFRLILLFFLLLLMTVVCLPCAGSPACTQTVTGSECTWQWCSVCCWVGNWWRRPSWAYSGTPRCPTPLPPSSSPPRL